MNKDQIRARYVEGLDTLPRHMHGGVSRYIERGIRPGDFLLCMLEGDMAGAQMRADPENRAFEKEWGVFLSDYVPIECHNTPEKVKAWMEHQGLSGLPDTRS